MGKNKGKGACNLRRKNMEKKMARNEDKEFNKIMEWKMRNNIPPLSFNLLPIGKGYIEVITESA